MINEAECQDPLLVRRENDATSIQEGDEEPQAPWLDICGKAALLAAALGLTNLLGYFMWLMFLEVGVEILSGSSVMDLILETPEVLVLAAISSTTLYFLFQSNNLDRIYQILKASGCCHCAMAAVILYVMNALVFLLFIMIGRLLQDEEEEWVLGSKTQVLTNEGRYDVKSFTTHKKKARTDVMEYGWAMVAVLVVNLGTIYFFCKRIASTRQAKAWKAVFSCWRTRKEYEEATLPITEVFQQIRRETCCFDLSWHSLTWILCCTAGTLALLGLVFLAGLVDSSTSTEGMLALFLLVPASGLWMYVYHLVSQGHFLVEDEVGDTMSCELTVASDPGNTAKQLDMERTNGDAYKPTT